MALTEKYVSSLAGGAGTGDSEASPWTFSQMTAQILANAGPGKRYNIKADGTYTRAANDDMSGFDGNNVNPIVLRGYKTVVGDGYQGRDSTGVLITTNMPLITYSSTFGMAVGNTFIFESLNIEGSVDGRTVRLGRGGLVVSCRFKNASNGAAAGSCRIDDSTSVFESDFLSTGSGSTVHSFDMNNSNKMDSCRVIVSGATGGGMSLGKDCVVYGCLIKGAGGPSGIIGAWTDKNDYIRNCTIVGFSVAIDLITTEAPAFIGGNMITGNTTWGIVPNATGSTIYIGPNRMRDNASGNIRYTSNWLDCGKIIPLVTTDTGGDETDYVNAAGNDYNLIAASPGKGVNRPKVSDMGPYGLPDPSGGGGTAVFSPLGQFIIRSTTSQMNPELEETIYADFVTSSPTTGAAADADSLPTCEVFEDASDTAILSPTVTKRTGKTGNYRVPIACTAANGFEAAKSYNVVVSATVGTVAAKAIIQTFQMRTNGADDLAASILTRATPAQVQAELATYGALKPTTAGRTLDISTGGEAGVDWANIGAPTTAQNLSATTFSSGQAVASVTNPVTLTAAYDAAKTAATQASVNAVDDFVDTEVNAIKAVTDKLDSTLEADGTVYRYTVNALEQAPAGGGGGETDWTPQERDQIRHRLGIDGAVAVPIAGIPSLASQASSDAIKSVTDKLNTTLQPDGLVHQFTANALELAPAGTGGNGNGVGTPTQENPCAQNPAQTRGPTTEPLRVSYRA